MEGDSKFKLRVLASYQNSNDSPTESHYTHRTNFLLLLNKWQKFFIDISMDHFDSKLRNKSFYLLFSYTRVLLVKHITSKEVSHVHRVPLVNQFITNLPRTTRIEAKNVIDEDYDFITGSFSSYIDVHSIYILNNPFV